MVWTVLAVRLRSPRATAFALPPLVQFLLTNVLQHVNWAVHLAAYDPGLVAAVTLRPQVTGVLIWSALREGLVPAWYVVVLMLIRTFKKRVAGSIPARLILRLPR
jgi:hypothetical protein